MVKMVMMIRIDRMEWALLLLLMVMVMMLRIRMRSRRVEKDRGQQLVLAVVGRVREAKVVKCLVLWEYLWGILCKVGCSNNSNSRI